MEPSGSVREVSPTLRLVSLCSPFFRRHTRTKVTIKIAHLAGTGRCRNPTCGSGETLLTAGYAAGPQEALLADKCQMSSSSSASRFSSQDSATLEICNSEGVQSASTLRRKACVQPGMHNGTVWTRSVRFTLGRKSIPFRWSQQHGRFL